MAQRLRSKAEKLCGSTQSLSAGRNDGVQHIVDVRKLSVLWTRNGDSTARDLNIGWTVVCFELPR